MNELPKKVAYQLASAACDVVYARDTPLGPKQRELMTVRLDAMCDLVHAYGYGMTPTAVRRASVTVAERYPRPAITAGGRATWATDVTEAMQRASVRDFEVTA